LKAALEDDQVKNCQNHGHAGLVAVLGLTVANAFAVSAMAADSGWLGASGSRTFINSLRSGNEFAVSAECRNASTSKTAFKPEIRIVSGPNSQKKDWAIVASDYPYQPGASPAEWGNWSKVSGNVLIKPGSGGKFYCAVYHHKKAGTYSRTAPPLSRKTAGGYSTIR
jgi:hypothetical protein